MKGLITMKEKYEALKMDVISFDVNILTATATTASSDIDQRTPADPTAGTVLAG